MRTCLSYGLYKNLLQNFHQSNESGRLFEIGSTFWLRPDKSYGENQHLSLVAWGREENLWTKDLKTPLVFELKAALENILSNLQISAYSWQTPSDRGEVPAFIHRGQFAQLMVDGKKIGFIGSLHPAYLDEDKVRVPAALAEIDLEILLQHQSSSYRIESISKMPVVQRDFAFVMPKHLKVGEVVKEIKKLVGPLLLRTEIFDLYEGDKLEPGQKSVAFRIFVQEKNGTLQENQLVDLQNKVIDGLKTQFDLTIR